MRKFSRFSQGIQARKDFNVSLGWPGPDWPRQTAYGSGDKWGPKNPIGREDVPLQDFINAYPWVGNPEVYNNALSIEQVTCGALANSFNAE